VSYQLQLEDSSLDDVDEIKRLPANLKKDLYGFLLSVLKNPVGVPIGDGTLRRIYGGRVLVFRLDQEAQELHIVRWNTPSRVGNPESPGRRYRDELLRKAPEFGLTRVEVESFDNPVLVRVIDGLASTAPASELTAAVRRFNEGLTQGLSPRARAVAEAKVLSPTTIEALGELLAMAGDASLRDVLRESPRAVLEILERDGVVTAQNRAEWVQGAGLSDQAKDRVEGMFVGRVVGSGERFSAAAPSLLVKLERAAPALIRVAGLNPALDEIPRVQRAMDVLADAAAHGITPEDLARQHSLFGSGPEQDPETMRMALLLDRLGPRAIGDRFRAWSKLAAYDPRQVTMFGKPPSRADAEAKLFEGLRTANPMRPMTFIYPDVGPEDVAAMVRRIVEDTGGIRPGTFASFWFVKNRSRPAELLFNRGNLAHANVAGRADAKLQRAVLAYSDKGLWAPAEHVEDCRCENPRAVQTKLPPPSPLVRSLSIALAAKWKAENAGRSDEARRLERRVRDLERGVASEGRDRLGQAFRLAHGIARRAGMEVGR
jgi:hypothetical protein